MIRLATAFLLFLLSTLLARGEDVRSDSAVVHDLCEEGYCPVDGNSVYLLDDAASMYRSLFDDIRSARRYVYVEFYQLLGDSIAPQLIDLLVKKHQEGLDVRLIYDQMGSDEGKHSVKAKALRRLEEHGVPSHCYRPAHFPLLHRIYQRDHRKLAVIDDEVAYTGGMNVSDVYVVESGAEPLWRDVHLRIIGPAASEYRRLFSAFWQQCTGECLAEHTLAPAVRAGSMRVVAVPRTRRVSPRSMRQLHVSLFDNAQHSVYLAVPYLTPTTKVDKAIRRAIRRGVDVHIMISEKSDVSFMSYANLQYAYEYMRLGAHVDVLKEGFYHAKLLVVDSLFCSVGTCNLDALSLRHNCELNTLVLDPRVAKDALQLYERERRRSAVPLDSIYYKVRMKWRRFLPFFYRMAAPFV